LTVEQQGWGPILDGYGAPLRKLLQQRDGQATAVLLADGRELLVYDVSWGRDAGDWWEHVICNTSLESMQTLREIYFFRLSEVVNLRDPETQEVLLSQTPAPGTT
jgi:hypothetical protein